MVHTIAIGRASAPGPRKEESIVPKYLFTARYSLEGIKAVAARGGSVRKTAVQAAVKSLGGKLEAFYFGFGSDDAFVIAELPGNEAAAALAVTVSAAGASTVRTTVLLTPAEMDAATSQSVAYRPPKS